MLRASAALAVAALMLTAPSARVDQPTVATIPVGQINYYQLPTGDMDHDGRQELAFEQADPPFWGNIWENWGSNSYQPVKIMHNDCGPAAEGDPDRDGRSDLLCLGAGRAVLLESTRPDTFPSRTVWEETIGGFSGLRGYFEDTDRDGRQEMWIVPNDPHWVEVWENCGDDCYTRVATLSDPVLDPTTLAFGDFDSDGKTEIVVGNVYRTVFVWEAAGDDTWSLEWTYQFLISMINDMVAAAHDLDGDGSPEFLVGSYGTYSSRGLLTMFEATGEDAYAPAWGVRGAREHLGRTRVEVGDVDGDGLEELAVLGITPTIQIYEATGDDRFRVIGEIPYDGGDFAIALADLDGDGVDELIAGDGSDAYGIPTRIDIDKLPTFLPPASIPAWYPTTYTTPSGQRLSVHAEAANKTDATQIVDLWVQTYEGPGQGGPQGTLLGQRLLASDVPLGAHQLASRDLRLALPPTPGAYTLQLQVGTYPDQATDTKWFTVVVSP